MISVVIPVYNEEGSVIPLHTELKKVLTSLSQKHEIIFIDDGSTDNTLTNLCSLLEKGEGNLKIIQLQKRFKKSAALVAGFNSAMGDIIITMDGDGQDDPQNIPLLLKKLTEDTDVVCGWRHYRQDSFLFKKLPSWIYNKLNRVFNKVKLHDSNCMLRVYRKEATTGLVLRRGDHRYIPAILLNRGFKFDEAKVNHRRRKSGKSKYGIMRIFTGFSDFMTFRFLRTGFLAKLIVRQKTTTSSLYTIKQVFENM